MSTDRSNKCQISVDKVIGVGVLHAIISPSECVNLNKSGHELCSHAVTGYLLY